MFSTVHDHRRLRAKYLGSKCLWGRKIDASFAEGTIFAPNSNGFSVSLNLAWFQVCSRIIPTHVDPSDVCMRYCFGFHMFRLVKANITTRRIFYVVIKMVHPDISRNHENS